MDVYKVKNILLTVFAAAGSFCAKMLGGWDMSIQALISFMAADYVTGLILAGVFKRSDKTSTGALESRAGFKGLMRKCAVLLTVFLGTVLDHLTGAGIIRTAVCLFFCANEGISVLENLGLMGVPYPAFLREMLEALRKENDSAERIEK